eukprot:scaffold28805_cov23-Tisochrysis_lutea.AAC.1
MSPVLLLKCRWVFNIVRGIDDEAVKPKDCKSVALLCSPCRSLLPAGLIKSLNSCKSFGATSNRNE